MTAYITWLLSRKVVLRGIHSYAEHSYRLTVPSDPEIGVTTSDDGGCW